MGGTKLPGPPYDDCVHYIGGSCVKQNCQCMYLDIISGTERAYVKNK